MEGAHWKGRRSTFTYCWAGLLYMVNQTADLARLKNSRVSECDLEGFHRACMVKMLWSTVSHGEQSTRQWNKHNTTCKPLQSPPCFPLCPQTGTGEFHQCLIKKICLQWHTIGVSSQKKKSPVESQQRELLNYPYMCRKSLPVYCTHHPIRVMSHRMENNN